MGEGGLAKLIYGFHIHGDAANCDGFHVIRAVGVGAARDDEVIPPSHLYIVRSLDRRVLGMICLDPLHAGFD